MREKILGIAVLLGLAVGGPAVAHAEDAEALKKENARLRAELKRARAEALQLTKEKNDLRDRAVAAEIQAKALEQRVQDLLSRVEKLARELARAKAAAAGKEAGRANPPAEDVKGLVEKVDGSGLVTLNVGSDAGLAKGHTLEVYRLNPQPKYLGRLRVVEVSPKQSVGKPVGRLTAPIQKGDEVASRIMGK
jgi:hypothetical protein